MIQLTGTGNSDTEDLFIDIPIGKKEHDIVELGNGCAIKALNRSLLILSTTWVLAIMLLTIRYMYC